MVGQIAFPKNEKGRVSTVDFSKKAWAASISEIDPNKAEIIQNETKWRESYSSYVEEHVKIALQSPSNAINMAKKGLDFMHENMLYITENGDEYPFSSVQTLPPSFDFHTGFQKNIIK